MRVAISSVSDQMILSPLVVLAVTAPSGAKRSA